MATKDISDAAVCRAYAEYQAARAEFVDEILARQTGEPAKVVHRAMERSERRGLVECGVSLRSGWLTELGIAEAGARTS